MENSAVSSSVLTFCITYGIGTHLDGTSNVLGNAQAANRTNAKIHTRDLNACRKKKVIVKSARFCEKLEKRSFFYHIFFKVNNIGRTIYIQLYIVRAACASNTEMSGKFGNARIYIHKYNARQTIRGCRTHKRKEGNKK